jgi:hypothetical protein
VIATSAHPAQDAIDKTAQRHATNHRYCIAIFRDRVIADGAEKPTTPIFRVQPQEMLIYLATLGK